MCCRGCKDNQNKYIHRTASESTPYLKVNGKSVAEAIGPDTTLARLLTVGTTATLLLTGAHIDELLRVIALAMVLVGLLGGGGGGGGVLVDIELMLLSELVVGIILTLLEVAGAVALVGCCCVAFVVTGAGLDDPEESLLLTNLSAAWPYSRPYPWCVLASLPLQQYGSAESQ
jgi:hypothetical protein